MSDRTTSSTLKYFFKSLKTLFGEEYLGRKEMPDLILKAGAINSLKMRQD
jgi:hypothetical protein